MVALGGQVYEHGRNLGLNPEGSHVLFKGLIIAPVIFRELRSRIDVGNSFAVQIVQKTLVESRLTVDQCLWHWMAAVTEMDHELLVVLVSPFLEVIKNVFG